MVQTANEKYDQDKFSENVINLSIKFQTGNGNNWTIGNTEMIKSGKIIF